eukprot:2119624-Lingulodinium_polyedra.AAC.1
MRPAQTRSYLELGLALVLARDAAGGGGRRIAGRGLHRGRQAGGGARGPRPGRRGVRRQLR